MRFTGNWRGECSACNYIPLVFLSDGCGQPLRNVVISLADTETRFSISVVVVWALDLVSVTDLI